MKLSYQSGQKPLWRQLYDILESRILSGEYKEGELMPSEVNLIKEFDVSRVTVRQAMDKLINSKLILRKPGKGTYVLKRENRVETSFQSSFHGIKEKNNTNDRRVIDLAYVTPPIEVAYFFDISTDVKVLKLTRETYVDDKPVTYYESYLNPLVPLNESTDFEKSMYKKLEEVDYPITHVKEQITASLINKAEMKIFKTDKTQAIMNRIRKGSSGETPVEYTISKYIADGYELVIDLK